MSFVEQVQRMARWDVWANRCVGDVLAQSNGEPSPALAAYQHVLEAELTWLRRMANEPDANTPLWGTASLDQVAIWQAEAAARMSKVAEVVDDAFLARTFEYTNSRDQKFADRVEDPLLHVFLHSQQYRGEAAAFLNATGNRVPDFDFIFWLRQGEPGAP